MVYKPVEGNPADDSSYYDFGTGSDGDNITNPEDQDNPEPTDEYTQDIDPNEDGNENVVNKDAPNTASPMTITVIVLSVIFVGIAIFSFISRTHPELLKKISMKR